MFYVLEGVLTFLMETETIDAQPGTFVCVPPRTVHTFTNRSDAIYTKEQLLVDDNGRARRMPWELWLGGEDDHTSAWMRSTSPSGSSAYEGRVGWSGELGFGVRPPEHGQQTASPKAQDD